MKAVTLFNLLSLDFAAAGAIVTTDLAILFELSERRSDGPDKRSPTRLAHVTGLSTANITGALHRFEKSGLIARHRRDDDLRKWDIQLSEKAKGLFDKYQLYTAPKCPKTRKTPTAV